MNAQHIIYNEHNIECWVERQIDVLDCKYELNQISTEDYHKKMDEINRQSERFYAAAYREELQEDGSFVYEL